MAHADIHGGAGFLKEKVRVDMEENKVAMREKLARLVHRAVCSLQCSGTDNDIPLTPRDLAAADAILQSPDLRVTLVEPKYHWIGKCVYLRTGEHTAKLIATCFDSELARDYADWLNSKEPK